jgi:site-specific DNA-methyltransferase (adenine-specific)
VLVDPPYGIGLRNGDVDGHRSDRWGSIEGDEDGSLGVAVLEWARSERRTVATFASPWKPWPGQWRNLIVWDKGGAVGGGGDIATCLKRSWELVQVWNPEPIAGPRAESVWRVPIVPADTEDHICAKPVALLARLIEVFTPPGCVVLDPTCGSGTTGVAAIKTGRRFIGIEIDPGYADIARRRIREATPTLFAEVARPQQLTLGGEA